jgi:hypothetical protein
MVTYQICYVLPFIGDGRAYILEVVVELTMLVFDVMRLNSIIPQCLQLANFRSRWAAVAHYSRCHLERSTSRHRVDKGRQRNTFEPPYIGSKPLFIVSQSCSSSFKITHDLLQTQSQSTS